MRERPETLEYMRQTVILELGLIALVEGDMFEDCYEEKLDELRHITGELIELKEKK